MTDADHFGQDKHTSVASLRTDRHQIGITDRHRRNRHARFIDWLGIAPSKFYSWRRRYGCANEHNGWVPRDFWLEEWEKQAIVDFYREHPLEGYRRLTFMMLDSDIVAVSPSSVWRVLSRAGLLRKWNGKSECGHAGPRR